MNYNSRFCIIRFHQHVVAQALSDRTLTKTKLCYRMTIHQHVVVRPNRTITMMKQQFSLISQFQFNTTRQPFKGAEDETVQLTSQTSVRTSTPVGKTVIPRPKIPESLIQHQTDHATWKKKLLGRRWTPQSFFKPSAIKLVSPPSSLPTATLPMVQVRILIFLICLV